MKKAIVLFTAIAMVVGMVGVAAAANRVQVNVTSEPVPPESTCAKAGGFSMEWDEGSTLVHNDVYTIDLPVPLCNPIDYVIAPKWAELDTNDLGTGATPIGNAVTPPSLSFEPGIGTGVGWSGVQGGTFTNIPLINTPGVAGGRDKVSPVKMTSVQTVNRLASGDSIIFHVFGSGDRITVRIIGYNNGVVAEQAGIAVTAGDPAVDDVLQVFFLDGTTNQNAAVQSTDFYHQDSQPGVWTPGATTYSVPADVADVTLCINPSVRVPFSPIEASINSRGDKFTFLPSNPQIAHAGLGFTISRLPCKDRQAGTIETPEGQGATCSPFDNESGAGYCPNTHVNNQIVIVNDTGAFDGSAQYQVRLTIDSPSGVYWGDGAVNYALFSTPSCDPSTAVVQGSFTGTYEHRNSQGNVITFDNPGSTNCSVPATAQSKVLLTDAINLMGSRNNITAAWIDLPQFVFDASVAAGQQVRISIDLIAAPCTEFSLEDILIGTFVNECGDQDTGALLFPYMTAPNNAFFQGSFSVANLSDEAGGMEIYWYEADGDIFTTSTTDDVAAHETWIPGLLDTFTGNPSGAGLANWTAMDAGGGGTIGDSRAYMVVCTDFPSDGFSFIYNPELGPSMGFLPRSTATSTAIGGGWENVCDDDN